MWPQQHHRTSEGTDAKGGCWGQEGNTGEKMKRWGLKVEVTGSWPVSTNQTTALRAVSKDSFLTRVASHCHHLACHKPYQQSYKSSLTDFSLDTESMQSLD